MSSDYILVEAINFDNNIFDTDQLSIIRGSSLLLKEAIEAIKKAYKTDLKAITTGASSGIFRVISHRLPHELLNEIADEFLGKHPQYGLFTFALETCNEESFAKAKPRLINQLRRHQMRSLSVPSDITSTATKPTNSNLPCELDGRRLQSKKVKLGEETKIVSSSIAIRLQAGRTLRRKHYKKELERYYKDEMTDIGLDQYTFSQDLESLAKCDKLTRLNNKLAVIYIDGNHFGKIQQTLLENADNPEQAQQDFDDDIQKQRAELLLNLLQSIIANMDGRFPHALFENAKKETVIRLETLLWGGDEFTIVVPAWLGFEVLQRFFHVFANQKNRELTYAAGIVFCQAKSPIRIMRELARELADNIKDQPGGREKNYWDYMILESIDYPANNRVDEYFHDRYHSLGLNKRPLLPAVSEWQKQSQKLHRLFEKELPKGQLYQIIQAIQKDVKTDIVDTQLSWDKVIATKNEALSHQEKQERRLYQVSEIKTNIPKLADATFGISNFDDKKQRAMFWLHLLECWDYLLIQPQQEQRVSNATA